MSDVDTFDPAVWDASQNDNPLPLLLTLGVAAVFWVTVIGSAISVMS